MALLQDGYQVTYTFASSPRTKFTEISSTPPGMSGGGPNNQTTQANTRYRTSAPKKLMDVSPMTSVVAYDAAVYDEIIAALQVNQLITITFEDNSTLAFYGWLEEFTPGEQVEGERPTATITIIPSNLNGTTETAPNYTAAP